MHKGDFVVVDDEAPYAVLSISANYNTLNFTSPDGRTAVIDFSGESITYEGDLPVSESAKLFFEAYGNLVVVECKK